MSLQNRHIIQKQFIEVEMQNPPDAFAFRNRLGELYYQRILPGLENVFNEIGTEHKLIRKDFLEIDLGIISSKNWEELFVDGAIRKIKEALSLESGMSLGLETGIFPNKTNAFIKSSDIHTARADKEIEHNENVEDVFFFFLKNGFLPWYVVGSYDLKKELIIWIDQQPSSFKKSFLNFLKNGDRKFFLRLIYQFDDEILNSILSLALEEKLWKEIKHYKRIITAYLRTFTSDSSIIKRLFYYPLLQSSFFENNNAAILYLSFLIEEIQTERPVADTGTILKEIEGLIESLKQIGQANLLAAIRQSMPAANLSKKREDKKDTPSKKTEEETEGIYIQNAGLVILHPFLSLFFGQIGLTDDKNNFKDETSHQKAVLISQYLVTGETDIPEEDIVLNKIICGYPFEESIPKELQLSELEIAEAEDLLTQVMRSWKMSGTPVNNSSEGLQESFLQRAGKLVQKETDWLLQVEQKPYDMVLSSLPWGIGIIKNSWMKGMLWVEWT